MGLRGTFIALLLFLLSSVVTACTDCGDLLAQSYIYVDTTKLILRLQTQDNQTFEFPILIGKKINNNGVTRTAGTQVTCTPLGKFKVTYKYKDPYYQNVTPGAEKIKPWKIDKRNKYGTRIIGLNFKRKGATRGLSIHGTNEPELIPGYGSNMCIRLKNKDVEILYNYLKIGDCVIIE